MADLSTPDAEMSESEARKSAILQASLDCILSIDASGRILEFNQTAENTFGWKFLDIVGKDMADLIVPDRFRAMHRAGMNRYLATGEGPVLGKRLEMPALRADGSEFPVELSIVPLKVKGEPVFTGFIRDLTEQKKSEADVKLLREGEADARARLEMQFKVMSILGAATSLREASSRVLQTIAEDLHWTIGAFWIVDEHAEVLRSTEIWHTTDFVGPEFIKVTEEWTFSSGHGLPGRVWASKEPAWIVDVVDDQNFPRRFIAHKNNLHGAFAFPILNGGKVLGVMEFLSPEVRLPDQHLLYSVATLGGQIGQFMRRLEVEEKLRNAIEIRDEFLSVASHELKTPLTSLKLRLEMINRGSKASREIPEAAAILDSVGQSLKQVDSLANLVEELLDVAKIRTGKFKLNIEPTDLSKLIAEMTDRFSHQLIQSGSQVELNLEPSLIGQWDPYRIEQIFVNLISNIIKYAPGKPAKISSERRGDFAVVTIEDQGPGIPSAMHQRIFERFERATSSENTSGLGLGLFVVKSIIETHGGQIQIDSVMGKGSTFTIELPLVIPSLRQIPR